jgi:O-antigen/teichoic acid export membrane protein
VSSLGRNTRINMLANAILGALGILSGSIVSYRYGAGQRGAIGVSQVLAALSASLGALGLGDAILHMLAKRRRITLAQLLGYALLTIPLAGLLGVGAGLAVAKVSGDLFNLGTMAFFCALLGASGAVFSLLGGALRGLSDFVGWNVLRIAAAVVWVLALLVRDGSDFDPIRAAITYAVLMSLVCLAQALRIRKLLAGRAARIELDQTPGLRLLLRFGLPSAFATTPLLLNARLDQVALGLVANKVDVGHYVAAVGYCWATVPLGQAIATQAATTIAAASNPLPEIQKLCRLAGAVIVGSGLLAWILAPEAIRLLNGDGFESSVGLARILLVGTTLQGTTYLLEEISRGLGAPSLALRAELAGLISMVLLLLVLASHGGTATAIASSIGYLISTLVAARSASRLVGVPIRGLVRGDSLVKASTSDRDIITKHGK